MFVACTCRDKTASGRLCGNVLPQDTTVRDRKQSPTGNVYETVNVLKFNCNISLFRTFIKLVKYFSVEKFIVK